MVEQQQPTKTWLGHSDELLHVIGTMFPGEWDRLGIYLGIPYDKLLELEKVKTCREMTMEILKAWWSRTTPDSRWGELRYAYTNIHRHDLLSASIKFFQRHAIDYHNPDQSLMDQYFSIVADEIMSNEWQAMGINLGLPLEKVRAIGQHPEQDKSRLCFKVLKLWQSSPASSHHELIRVLRDDMCHRDLVRFIHQYLFETEEVSPEEDIVCVCDCDLQSVSSSVTTVTPLPPLPLPSLLMGEV